MQLKKTTLALSASGLFACGAVAGWVSPSLMDAAHAAGAEGAVPAAIAANAATAPAPVPMGAAPNYRAIVAQNRNAVVGIRVDGSQPVSDEQSDGSPFGDDGPSANDPFFRFFRGIPIPHQPHNVPMHGLGSGFIVRSDGLVLTNAHVVRDAQHVTVTLADHHEYRAKVLGIDTATDVAVLKVEAHNLPTVRFGDSSQLQVGDYVLAIGQPYGLEETATAGIVSAKGRSLPGDSYVPFIQTDVAVNPGNSGGPLFDARGEVVGINSQIYSNTGGYQGVSFAIPIDVAARVQQQILKNGKVEHARLGIEVQAVNQALAGSFKLPAPEGALVAKVNPESAAARAGVQVGDVIVKFNGHPVSDSGSLSAQVGMSEPGDVATLELYRGGKLMTLKATLGNASAKSGQLASAGDNEHGRLGLAVRPLTRDERQEAGLSSGGLVVEQASGPAADAGIQPGDVVLSADGAPVDSVEQLRNAVRNRKDTVALLIQRGDQRIFIPVLLG